MDEGIIPPCTVVSGAGISGHPRGGLHLPTHRGDGGTGQLRMVPRVDHQGTHSGYALMTFGSGRVRFGSTGSRDGAWGIPEF